MMVISSNGILMFAALFASLALWLPLIRKRFRYLRQPWSVVLSFPHVGLTLAAAVVLWPPGSDVCRDIPFWYLVLWMGLLGGGNFVLGISFFHIGFAAGLARTVGDWIRRGGFWGNHWSEKSNERWPSTRDNAWAASALLLWLLVVLSWWLHGRMPAALEPPTGEPSLLSQATATVERAFEGTNTPVELLLQWRKSRAEAATAAAVVEAEHTLPPYPKSTSWRWLFWFGLIYVGLANLWCRRDWAGDLLEWISNRFRRRREQVAVSGVSEVLPPPAPAPAAALPAIPSATATAGIPAPAIAPAAVQPTGMRAAVETVIGPVRGLAREVVKEAVAEGIWETIPRKIGEWFKKK